MSFVCFFFAANRLLFKLSFPTLSDKLLRIGLEQNDSSKYKVFQKRERERFSKWQFTQNDSK